MTDAFDWSAIDDALAFADDEGHGAAFWWRDDDAVQSTEKLDRLLSLVNRFGTGLLIASIPSSTDESLSSRLGGEENARVAVHGISHTNNAPPDQKKQELGNFRSSVDILGRLRDGHEKLRELFGSKCLPVLVPPWNRISSDIVAGLPGAGFTGLSCFGDESRTPSVQGLQVANTQVDPIFWRGGGGLCPPDMLADMVAGSIRARQGRPIGLLTHHLVHDEAVWNFLEEFCERIARSERAIWMAPQDVFRERGP